jgi:ATP-dependent DNA helicase RecQ
MLHYAEIASCRREFLLGYFGEKFLSQPPALRPGVGHPPAATAAHDDNNCAGCDNCLAPRATWDGTIAAQKFLSCVYRIRENSSFGVGVQHVVEVLCGADTEKIRKFGHHRLSTYNIGGEHSRAEWGAIGRELVRLGLLLQNAEKFNIVELTAAGIAALKSRTKVTLTKPVTSTQPEAPRVGEIACDEVLFEKLRGLRKQLADERAVPPYIIFSDVSLRQMSRLYPANNQDFSRISGVGDRKLREFGEIFLREIAAHLQSNARQIFADDSFTVPVDSGPRRSGLSDTVRETLAFFRQGKSVPEISRLRQLQDGTIYNHLEEALLAGETVDVNRLVSAPAQKEIAAAFARYGFGNLTGVVESLGGKYGYGQCRLVRVALQR